MRACAGFQVRRVRFEVGAKPAHHGNHVVMSGLTSVLGTFTLSTNASPSLERESRPGAVRFYVHLIGSDNFQPYSAKHSTFRLWI